MHQVRPRCLHWGLAALVVLGGRLAAGETLGRIERVDPRFDALVPLGAEIEKLGEGYEWTEGPVWVPAGGYLLFSDIPNNVVMKWQPGTKPNPHLKPAGYTGPKKRGGELGSNGLLLDPAGRLVLCQHGDRRVARLNDDGSFTTLADRYQGKRLNSPNDAAYKSNGDLYFTDPPYGLEGKNDDPAKETDFNGVYRLASDGTLTLLTDKQTYPNGIGFSPDEKTLYVANSDPKQAVWYAYPVKGDGTLGAGRVLFDATSWTTGKKGLPDGLKVAPSGHLFATGPGGVHVFTPNGEHLGSIDPGEATANCAFDADGKFLYLTSDMYLCRVPINSKSLGF